MRTQKIIAELGQVEDRLSDFYAPDEARQWLRSCHPLLHGERAIDLIVSGRTDEVFAAIERLEAGAYV